MGELATAIQQLLAAIASLAATTPSGGGIAQHIAAAQAALDAYNLKENLPPKPAEEPKAEEPASEPAAESNTSSSRSGRH